MTVSALLRRHVIRPVRRILEGPPPPAWYHPEYRLASASSEGRLGLEPRRADFVAYALRAVKACELRSAAPVSYAELARVHSGPYLESLHDPATLGRIFALDPDEVRIDELMRMGRLACGGTLAAARAALARRGPALNLLGGFHHAGPDRGGGLCALNDIAVAVAALRAERWSGQVVVIDLDAHPPDGLAACLDGDPACWIGSLSGARWEPLPARVDETVLPPGTGDDAYLAALAALLGRMPRPALAFVIAGGDVLAGDRLGKLGLTLAGARRRDQAVKEALGEVASVWLPGGGYHPDAWKVVAGSGMVAAGRGDEPVALADPLSARFREIAGVLEPDRLTGDDGFGLRLEDIEADLDRRPREGRLLGVYTSAGIEYALERYGVLPLLVRLGYGQFRVVVDRGSIGDRARLFGASAGVESLLVETVLERRFIGGIEVLFVHWLNLRNPLASRAGALLPGQDVPGLGLAREMAELFERMAARLGLQAVAFRPSHYHLAYVARSRYRFLDPRRQGRFEALLRDLSALALPEATRAVAEGRVRLDGEPYAWEADDMVDLLRAPAELGAIAAERDRVHFTVA